MVKNNTLEFVVKLKDEFSSGVKTLSGSMSSIGGVMSTALNVAAGAAVGVGTAIFAMTNSVKEAYEAVTDMAAQLGITTEAFSGLAYAAKMENIEIKQLEMGLKRLSITAGEASQGNEMALESFTKLGISIRDDVTGNLKDASQLLPEVADKINGMESSVQRAAVTAELFGARNLIMLRLLNQGSEGIKAYQEEAEKFGLVVSKAASDAAGNMDTAMKRMQGAITGTKNAFAEQFMPIFTAGMNQLAEIIADNRQAVAQWGYGILQTMLMVAKGITLAVAGWKDIFTGLNIALAGIKASGADMYIKSLEKSKGELYTTNEKLLAQIDKENDPSTISRLKSQVRANYDLIATLNDEITASKSSRDANWQKIEALRAMETASDKAKESIEKLETAMKAADPRTFVGPPAPRKERTGGTELPDLSAPSSGGESDKQSEYKTHLKDLENAYAEYTMTKKDQILAWYEEEKEIFKGQTNELAMLDKVRDAKLAEASDEGMEAVRAAYEKATMSEAQIRDKKYADDLAAYEGNQEALKMITETYNAEKLSEQNTILDELTAQRDEATLNEMDRLNIWFAEQQLKYEENADALLLIEETYQARRNTLLENGYKTFEEENETFLSSIQAQFNEWQLSQADKNRIMSGLLLDSLDTFSQGLGDAVAQAVVYGKDMGEMMDALMKQIAANIISTLVNLLAQMAIQAVLANVLNTTSKTAQMSTSVAAAAATTYAEVFATYAPIPYVGPALGAAAGAAAVAALIAGSGASFATAKGAGMAMGKTGGAMHGGMTSVPKEQTYLLDEGERVLSPNQNADLINFMSEFQTIAKEGGTQNITTGGDTRIDNLTIRVLDNATNYEGLLRMDASDWEDIVYTRIIPAMQRLKGVGVQV